MKNLLFVFIIFILFTVAGCSGCKNTITPTPDNPYGLPNATQTGAGTLGFLLNGQVWTPQGHAGSYANFTVNYDPSYNHGILNIYAYRIPNGDASKEENFGITITDSLNFLMSPFTLPLGKNTLFDLAYYNYTCSYLNTDIGLTRSGSLTITKLDKTNRIVSGTFNATLYKNGCDTIKITEGRFDMKY